MRLVLQLLAVVAIAFVGGQVVAAVLDNPWLTLGIGVLTSVLAILVYGWVVRRTERRPSVEVSRKGALSGLGLGMLIGAGLFGLVIANIASLGDYTVKGFGSMTTAVGLVGYMAAAAVTEELLFRGVLFRQIERGLGTWIATLITSVLFGAYHLLNPDASLVGAIVIAVEAGSLFAMAYAATRKLWVPIGIHFAWNFAAAGVFSTEVSGNGSNKGILDSAMSGSTLVTGGEFGPELSLYSVVFCVLAAVVFAWIARRRGNLVPLRRSARAKVSATTS